ncbi:MAG: MFS transporter [Ardenticatenaceae bacterium]|nr:MFS transporter [Anaerolineales bacterium]MCB8917221.1 MFS transporter [Ardenticatenaceae bacterium]
MNNSPPPRFAALQYRDFRLLWFGRLLSAIGSQMQLIAVNWHVVQLLTDQRYEVVLFGRPFTLAAEALGLGTLGLVRIIPVILFALLGGMLADSLDRRKLLIGAQTAAAIFSALLAAMTLAGQTTLPLLYLLTAAGAATFAFDEPARQSIVPNIVPPRHLTNAVSLNTLLFYTASIVGPAVGGVLIGAFDLGLVYVIDAVSFLAVIIALLLMSYRGPGRGMNGGLGWAALVEGLRFTYRAPLIWSTMLLDFFATFFSSARTMLPLVARDVLGLGPAGYGLLATAQPAGAVLAGVVLAWRRDIRRQGVVLLVSVAIYGAATALFGISSVLWLSYLLFALTGAGDTVSTVIRGTIRQLNTPDRLRGRMTSVNMIFFMGGPQLGELEAGVVGSLLGVPFAIFSGGVATVLLTGWVAWRFPRLRRYTAQVTVEE